MAFSLNYDLNLDTAGLIDLRARFMVVDTGNLVNFGDEIATGFYEVGSGGYYWEYSNHADSFFGLVKFYRAAAPSTILGIRAIGPREAENLDAKVSSRMATFSYISPDNTSIAAIKEKTDGLPESPAATDDIPDTDAIVTAIMAYLVETGHDLDTVLKALYAVIRGRAVGDDESDPETVLYYAPDNTTVRVTHMTEATERTVA